MHILLININPVVSRLISLCVREEHINLEEIHNIWEVTRDRYDIVFIDEASYGNEAKEVLENLITRKKVLFSNSNDINNESRFFDTIIKKPFLPSQITAVLESLSEDDTLEPTTEIPSIFPLSSEKEDENETKSNEIKSVEVLDTNEIKKIKALLDMEENVEEASDQEYESRKVAVIKQQLIANGLEIIEEDEYIETLSNKPVAKKNQRSSEKNDDPTVEKKKKKTRKKSKKKQEEIFTFEEALLAAVEGMKVKKIKKLLKGAEVTIKINFKDNQ